MFLFTLLILQIVMTLMKWNDMNSAKFCRISGEFLLNSQKVLFRLNITYIKFIIGKDYLTLPIAVVEMFLKLRTIKTKDFKSTRGIPSWVILNSISNVFAPSNRKILFHS